MIFKKDISEKHSQNWKENNEIFVVFTSDDMFVLFQVMNQHILGKRKKTNKKYVIQGKIECYDSSSREGYLFYKIFLSGWVECEKITCDILVHEVMLAISEVRY